MSTDTPVISKASYDGTQVRVWWSPVSTEAVTGYKILVASNANGTVYESDLVSGRLSSYGALSLSAPLDTNIVYTLQVQTQTAGGPGIASPQVPMLTRLPVLHRAVYDGADLRFDYAPVPDTAAGGYSLKVYSQNSGTTYSAAVSDANAGTGVIPASTLPQGGLDPAQQWMVSVCAVGESSFTACTPDAALPLPAPALRSADYAAGARLTASWQAVSGVAGYVLRVTSPVDDTAYEVSIPDSAATGGTLSFPRPLYTAQPYVVQLLALNAAGAGVATPARDIITALPRIRSARYDGAAVALRWQASSDTSVTGYTLGVFSLSSGQRFSATVTGAATTAGTVAAAGLDPDQPWVATVSATAEGAAAGQSREHPLLVAQPQIDTVRYDGTRLVATWTPVVADSVTGYALHLLQGDDVVQSTEVENPLGSAAELPLAAPLGHATYTVRVDALATPSTSASATSAALLTTLPSIQYASYQGNQVVVGWSSYAGADSFTATLGSAQAGTSYTAAKSSGAARSATIDLPGVLGTDAGYLFVLCASTAGGISACTPPCAMPTVMAPLVSLVYDGAAVTGRWTPVTDSLATVTGYQLKVIAQGSGTTYQAETQDPLAGSLTITDLGGGLRSDETYIGLLVVLSENGANAWGAGDVLPAAVPRLSYASYAGNQITAGWQPAAAKAGTVQGYLMQVTSPQDDTDYRVSIPGQAATSGVLSLPEALSPGQRYDFYLSAVSADGAEGRCTAGPIVTARPVIGGADFDGQNIHLTWSTDQDAARTGFELKLISLNSGATYTATIANPYATKGDIPAPAGGLDPAQTWIAQVWAEGPVPGISDPVTLVPERAVIGQVRYDGSSVQATWAPARNPVVTGYLLTVTAAGAGTSYSVAVAGNLASSATLLLDAPLPAGDTWSAVVVALAGEVRTTSDALAVDLDQPAPASITYAGGAVAATWGAVTNTDVTGYTLVVTSRLSGQRFSADVDHRTTTGGSVTVDGLLGADEAYVFSLCTQNPSGAIACSPPAAIITRLPALREVSFASDGTLSATWSAEEDGSANLTGFVLALRPAGDTTPTASESFDSPFDRSGSFQPDPVNAGDLVDIRATAQSGAVSIGGALPLITARPTLDSVAYDQGVLTASWTAAADTSYRLDVLDANGSCVASAVAAGGQAVVAVALDPSKAFRAVLHIVSGIVTGPDSEPVDIIAGAPAVTSTRYDGGTLTVDFDAPPSSGAVTGYDAWLYQDGSSPVAGTVSGTRATFTAALAATKRYTVIVAATGSKTSGPGSPAAPAVAAVPAFTAAALSGATLTASWQPLAGSEVSGYHVQLLQSGAEVARFDTPHAALSESVTLAAGAPFTVKINAVAGLATGAQSDDFAVESYGFQYYVQPAQSTVQPYLYRTLQAAPPAEPAAALALYVPEVFNTPQTEPITQGAFTLTPTGDTPYAYVMRFDQDSAVWSFDNNAIRTPLQSDYNAFLAALEAVAGGMTELGLDLVREVLALGLPLTFDESLFYRYGFDPANGYCDLQPGMGLRLDSEVYQFVGTSGSATQVSGFVTVGSRSYEVGSYMASSGQRETGFNAFLSAAGRPSVAPNSRGAGGVIDLYATGFRRRYYRLFYPQSFVSSDSQGQVGIGNNAALLGCNSWQALTDATDIYLATGNFDSVTEDIAYTFFRGRMVSTPLLTVLLNGQPQEVAIGTTVRQLIQRYACLPMAAGTSVSDLDLERLTGNVVNAPQSSLSLDVSGRDPVRLTVDPFTIVLQHKDAFDLPLLGGDRLRIR